MLIALITLFVFSIVFVSAARYGRAMDELFGAPDTPTPPAQKPSMLTPRVA